MSTDLNTFLGIEKALAARMIESWRPLSADIYARMREKVASADFDGARAIASEIDLAPVGQQNREWVKYMLFAATKFGARNANPGDTKLNTGSFDREEVLNRVTANMIRWLSNRVSADVYEVALQSIAAAETTYREEQIVKGEKAPLYVRRDVLNGDELVAWAKENGFEKTQPADDMHVTVTYSKTPVDWDAVKTSTSNLTLRVSAHLKRLGEKGEAVVLGFKSTILEDRWQAYRDAGASWDWDEYQPHITISHDAPDLDVKKIKPFTGTIRLGPEIKEDLDEDWKDKVTEKGEAEGHPFRGNQWTGGLSSDAETLSVDDFLKGRSGSSDSPQPSLAKLVLPWLKGLSLEGAHHSLAPYGMRASDYFMGRSRLNMDGNSREAYAARIATGLVGEAVKGLPSDVQECIMEVKPNFAYVSGSPGDVTGEANINARTFNVNFKLFADELEGKTGDWAARVERIKGGSGYTVSAKTIADSEGKTRQEAVMDMFRQTIVHELAHIITSDAAIEESRSVISSLGADAQKFIKENISKYAAYNAREFIAESFTKYHSKGYVKGSMPKVWEDMVENLPIHKMLHLREEVTQKMDAEYTEPPSTPGPEFGSEEWFTDEGGDGPGPDKTAIRKANRRFVEEFVSFAKGGDESLQLASSLHTSRLATWGFVGEAESLGVTKYRLENPDDERTSKFCHMINGREFEVERAKKFVTQVLNADSPEDVKELQPWPDQDKASIARYESMTDEELMDEGLHIPPFHPLCRTILRRLSDTTDEPTDVEVPEEDQVPMEPEEDRLPTDEYEVTPATFREMGLEVTEEEAAEWKRLVGVNPVWLFSTMTGMEAADFISAKLASLTQEDGMFSMTAAGDLDDGEIDTNTAFDAREGTMYQNYMEMDSVDDSEDAVGGVFAGTLRGAQAVGATSIRIHGDGGNIPALAAAGYLPSRDDWEIMTRDAFPAAADFANELTKDRSDLLINLLNSSDPATLRVIAALPWLVGGVPVVEKLFAHADFEMTLDMTDAESVDRFNGVFHA